MFKETVNWRGQQYQSLQDIIKKDLDVLFVGLHPSMRSVDAGHYFQGNVGGRFWNTIIHSGILHPLAGRYYDEDMLSQNLGITHIVKRPTWRSAFLSPNDFEEGRQILFQKIVEYKPSIVCAIYKSVFEHLFETRFTNVHGLVNDFRIGRSRMFIMAPFFYPPEEREKTALELKKLREETTRKTKRRK